MAARLVDPAPVLNGLLIGVDTEATLALLWMIGSKVVMVRANGLMAAEELGIVAPGVPNPPGVPELAKRMPASAIHG